jgi:hypothetical protein
MSQKGNLQTVRPFLRSSNLFNLSIIEFLNSLNFIKFFQSFFNKKFFFPVDITFNHIGSKINVSIILFGRTVKILRFSRRLHFLRRFKGQKYLLTKFILDNLKNLGINVVSIKFVFINKVFSKSKKSRFLQVFYLKQMSFKYYVFERLDNLFFDYLKISFLFFKGLISPKVFLTFLANIFKFLPKYKHIKFINLLKKTFTFLVNPVLNNNDKLGGIKFSVAGKFKGKLRKSRVFIQVGKVPVQSISKNVEFCKIPVFTRYGVFGFKLWVFYR